MTTRLIGLFLALLALSACNDKKARWDAFMQKCLVEAQFTPPQCLFLFTLSEKSHSDSDDAVLLSMAVGISAGTLLSSSPPKR